jgi:hypothetical protein
MELYSSVGGRLAYKLNMEEEGACQGVRSKLVYLVLAFVRQAMERAGFSSVP